MHQHQATEHPQSFWNSSAARCGKEIEETYRPERRQRTETLNQGHHVHALVEGKRYGFAEACRLMEVDARAIVESLAWLEQDNERLNALFSTDIHKQRAYDYDLLFWMRLQTADLPSAEVVSIRRDNV